MRSLPVVKYNIACKLCVEGKHLGLEGEFHTFYKDYFSGNTGNIIGAKIGGGNRLDAKTFMILKSGQSEFLASAILK